MFELKSSAINQLNKKEIKLVGAIYNYFQIVYNESTTTKNLVNILQEISSKSIINVYE